MSAYCFNAARGFVGGAAPNAPEVCMKVLKGFNAARGFVGGAANLLRNTKGTEM